MEIITTLNDYFGESYPFEIFSNGQIIFTSLPNNLDVIDSIVLMFPYQH